MAELANALLVFGGFVVVFCALGATYEWLVERSRSRRLRERIGRYGGRRA